MADTGWRSPGTTIDDTSFGTKPWYTPNNAQSSDNAYATSFGGVGGGFTHYLKATNFGFSVPVGATIDGIVVEFERKAAVANLVSDFRINIVKADGAYGTENKAAGGYWSTTEAYYTYGGSSDLWSLAWTAANINHANFGVGISVLHLANGRADIDHVRITVYYTVPGPSNFYINVGDSWQDAEQIYINVGDVWQDVEAVYVNVGDSWQVIFSI